MNLERIPFHGQSMDPTFRGVDFLLVDFLKKSPEVGDVLIYRDSRKEWVCHRLIYKNHETYWLKGDYSTVCDQVNAQAVFAQVKGYERHGQRAVVQNSFLIRCACWLQRQQTQSSSVFAKKIFRYGALAIFATGQILFSSR